MEIDDVPVGLQARLGPEATGGLLQLLDRSHRQEREDVITACTERFERRLVEEVSGLRIQIAQVESTLRQDMAAMGATLRQEIATMGSTLRQELAAGRVEFIKWSFLFWVGQVLAVTGFLTVMLRLLR